MWLLQAIESTRGDIIQKLNQRGRTYRRYQKNRAINRKFGILKRIYGLSIANKIAPVKGCLSKGKIHCSCSICSIKSSTEIKHSDKKKMLKIFDL
ncbi:TPA: hypothetical protein N2D99_002191 [Clostridium botulinum]|nr:hypothetical protein [Clostridium botulinum]